MWLLFTGFILTALVIFDIVVLSKLKKNAYIVWKQEFEQELGSSAEKVDEIIIRELYDTTQSPKSAAEYYLETKYPIKLGDGIWDKIEGCKKIEHLTLDEIIERYDLTEGQIKELRSKSK